MNLHISLAREVGKAISWAIFLVESLGISGKDFGQGFWVRIRLFDCIWIIFGTFAGISSEGFVMPRMTIPDFSRTTKIKEKWWGGLPIWPFSLQTV